MSLYTKMYERMRPTYFYMKCIFRPLRGREIEIEIYGYMHYFHGNIESKLIKFKSNNQLAPTSMIVRIIIQLILKSSKLKRNQPSSTCSAIYVINNKLNGELSILFRFECNCISMALVENAILMISA